MTSYVPGDHPCLVTSHGVVMTAPDRLADVVALGERDLEPPTVVEVLSRGVLGDLPDFAAVRRDGAEVRIMVRGAFSVRVDGFALDGREAATWNEASAAIAAGSVVEVGPLGPVGPVSPVSTPRGGVTLPISAGVVHSSGVTWQLDPPAQESAATVPPAPAAVSVPPPVPAVPVQRADEYTAVRPARGAAPTPTLVVPAMPAAPAVSPVPQPAPPTPPTPPAPPPGWSPAPVGDPADHDGRTITPAQLQALRAAQSAPGTPGTPPVPPARVLVALSLSTGRVVPVRRRVLIGRSPRVQQVGGSANLPALVTVDDPYVSSTHLEVAAEGTRVTVTDTSTNGTLLARRGGTPFPLDHGVATEVAIGDVLTLSKGLTATLVPAPER